MFVLQPLGAAVLGLAILAAPPQVPPEYDDDDDGPIAETVWFNGFGLGVTAAQQPDFRFASGFYALGYEAVMNPYQAWAIDLRRDAYGGTIGTDAYDVRFAGVGFAYRYYPKARAPTGFYVSIHGALGYSTYVTDTGNASPARALNDGGAIEAGTTAGWSWTLWQHVQLRAGLGTVLLYVPDLDRTLVAGGLTGDLQIGYQF